MSRFRCSRCRPSITSVWLRVSLSQVWNLLCLPYISSVEYLSLFSQVCSMCLYIPSVEHVFLCGVCLSLYYKREACVSLYYSFGACVSLYYKLWTCVSLYYKMWTCVSLYYRYGACVSLYFTSVEHVFLCILQVLSMCFFASQVWSMCFFASQVWSMCLFVLQVLSMCLFVLQVWSMCLPSIPSVGAYVSLAFSLWSMFLLVSHATMPVEHVVCCIYKYSRERSPFKKKPDFLNNNHPQSSSSSLQLNSHPNGLLTPGLPRPTNLLSLRPPCDPPWQSPLSPSSPPTSFHPTAIPPMLTLARTYSSYPTLTMSKTRPISAPYASSSFTAQSGAAVSNNIVR